MAAAAILEKFQMAISSQPVVRSTSCLVIAFLFHIQPILRPKFQLFPLVYIADVGSSLLRVNTQVYYFSMKYFRIIPTDVITINLYVTDGRTDDLPYQNWKQ